MELRHNEAGKEAKHNEFWMERQNEGEKGKISRNLKRMRKMEK